MHLILKNEGSEFTYTTDYVNIQTEILLAFILYANVLKLLIDKYIPSYLNEFILALW